ncbi:DUF4055 domain-containing protein [uncultured Acinetobacter sp.]|uniref:DUF4055 domain-containing protein n=1 Tax=uncultured Acinetobacter sp. TaxID=165433 RepID=UPI00259123D9|nr:DUF4055 domain-containing protein [uncultured Acinetobacter sp.]
MPVNTEHQAYADMKKRWKTIDDVCDGSTKVKERGELYLPKPNVSSDLTQNDQYYLAYLTRAVFYEITKDTLNKMVGVVFAEDPTFEPDGMDFLKYDADGTGKSIYQVAQSALQGQLKHARGGLFVDYPTTDGNVSVQQAESLGIRPTIVFYESLSIINWSLKRVGSVYKPELIVLHEKTTEKDPEDEFSKKEINIYRVLRLDENNEYNVQVYTDKSGELQGGDIFYPTNSLGQRWNEIPFIPLGSLANDWNIDPIPLEPIVTMNLAHYQNSASYEEMVFICGQAQPVINELDEGWRDWLQKNGVRLGSKNPLMLPKGSSFDYKQVTESTLAKQAMDAKEKYMQAMGAKILETEQVNKTATQSNNEKLAQYSVLSLCVANTNEAMEYALKWCAAYYGSGSKAKLTIKQDFAKGKIDLDTLKFYWEMVLANRMSMETFHELLTTGKVPEISYEDEQTRIESESVNRPMVV